VILGIFDMSRDYTNRVNDRDFDTAAKKAQKSVEKKHKTSRRSGDKARLDQFVSDYTTGGKEYDENNDEEFDG